MLQDLPNTLKIVYAQLDWVYLKKNAFSQLAVRLMPSRDGLRHSELIKRTPSSGLRLTRGRHWSDVHPSETEYPDRQLPESKVCLQLNLDFYKWLFFVNEYIYSTRPYRNLIRSLFFRGPLIIINRLLIRTRLFTYSPPARECEIPMEILLCSRMR